MPRYVPRPEWYFLSLFQLLKYFPGPLEPLATMVIPGLVVGLLVLLPFLDRRPDRHFLKRPLVTAGFGVIGLGDHRAHVSRIQGHAAARRLRRSGGRCRWRGTSFVQDQRCLTCHTAGGTASELEDIRISRDPEWLISHARDPKSSRPGLARRRAAG